MLLNFQCGVGSTKENKDVKGGVTMTVESSVCVEWEKYL